MNLAPGLHYGIPAKAYHADPCPTPSLSSGIARTILSDSIAHAYKAHPKLGGAAKTTTEAMGLGLLVHSLMDSNVEKEHVLGSYSDYKGGEARQWRDSVSAMGKYPILPRDLVDAEPIAAALQAKAARGSDKTPFDSAGKSEVTAVWQEGDILCRARYDRIVGLDVWDWKTSNDVTDRGIIKSISKYGYHIQVAFYLRGLSACLGVPEDRLSFTLVFVETAAPYTVRRVRLTDTFLVEGRRLAKLAIEEWQAAIRDNKWDDPRELETFEAEMPMWMDSDNVEISTC